jgi:hypothetical protein
VELHGDHREIASTRTCGDVRIFNYGQDGSRRVDLKINPTCVSRLMCLDGLGPCICILWDMYRMRIAEQNVECSSRQYKCKDSSRPSSRKTTMTKFKQVIFIIISATTARRG